MPVYYYIKHCQRLREQGKEPPTINKWWVIGTFVIAVAVGGLVIFIGS